MNTLKLTLLTAFLLICTPLAMLANTAAAKAQATGEKAPASVEESIEVLRENGVIERSDYWLKNAHPGQKCSGRAVGMLIVNTVSKKKAVSSVEEACDYLHSQGLMDRPADWKRNARKGKTCKGESVAELIGNLATLLKR